MGSASIFIDMNKHRNMNLISKYTVCVLTSRQRVYLHCLQLVLLNRFILHSLFPKMHLNRTEQAWFKRTKKQIIGESQKSYYAHGKGDWFHCCCGFENDIWQIHYLMTAVSTVMNCWSSYDGLLLWFLWTAVVVMMNWLSGYDEQLYRLSWTDVVVLMNRLGWSEALTLLKYLTAVVVEMNCCGAKLNWCCGCDDLLLWVLWTALEILKKKKLLFVVVMTSSWYKYD